MNKRWDTLDTNRETMDTIPSTFSDVLDDFFNRAMKFNPGGNGWVPQLNVSETDTMFEITVELPGMSKDDIDISLEDHVLNISGERSMEKEESNKKYRRVESRFGTFSRSLPLPNSIDTDSVKASYENGILTIHIAKQEDKATKKIEVE
jgi:HSP20 family protein